MTEFKTLKWKNSKGEELSVAVEESKVSSFSELFTAEGKDFTIEECKL
tara:strand:- start:434 stop:577 length:144 start_codon:yes stop_codon:yes gene_type:complete